MAFFFFKQLFLITMKGVLNSEVYTPKNIVDRLISYASIYTGRSVCDPACGTGNILVGVIDYLKRNKFTDQEIADNIFGYDIIKDSVQVCRQRIKDLLPDVSGDLIDSHIQCCDTLKHVTNRFDAVIMNPPYAKDLHKKFLIWAATHADTTVSIQPCQFLYKHSGLNQLDTDVQNAVSQFVNTVYIMNPNLIWKDHKFASPVGIFIASSLKKANATVCIHDEMTGDIYTVVIDKICKRYNQLSKFRGHLYRYLMDNPDTVILHREKNEDAPYVVELAKIRGHISEVNKDIYSNDDFATMVTRGHLPQTAVSDPNKQHFWFDSETEAINFIDYLKTDFARLCLYINKFGLHIDSNNMGLIPWLDFKRKWTDYELFNLLGIKNPNLEDPTLLPKYYE